MLILSIYSILSKWRRLFAGLLGLAMQFLSWLLRAGIRVFFFRCHVGYRTLLSFLQLLNISDRFVR